MLKIVFFRVPRQCLGEKLIRVTHRIMPALHKTRTVSLETGERLQYFLLWAKGQTDIHPLIPFDPCTGRVLGTDAQARQDHDYSPESRNYHLLLHALWNTSFSLVNLAFKYPGLISAKLYIY